MLVFCTERHSICCLSRLCYYHFSLVYYWRSPLTGSSQIYSCLDLLFTRQLAWANLTFYPLNPSVASLCFYKDKFLRWVKNPSVWPLPISKTSIYVFFTLYSGHIDLLCGVKHARLHPTIKLFLIPFILCLKHPAPLHPFHNWLAPLMPVIS